ncbi:hypothetical protein IVB03_02955 [Bradyrhizobium sp. 168]|uniref:hypothetical protein n=1 Tax=Bradyrhizobium sp. 168 TaxID=2782639 RepID=UPI001FFADE94|nr:hypothetical protein [Bradyrhizobium sp. 168]MCK1578567.1 hypothetical protein [Bradyrhizobium sp. 168]
MWASKDRNDYEAMVSRVRKHYGSSVEVGGYNSHDILNLRKLDAKREKDEASDRDQAPLNEAGTRLHQTRARAMKAWRTIKDGTDRLAKDRRVHLVNGIPPELLEPADMPRWSEESSSTVAGFDRLNAEASLLATDLETRASKLVSYRASWEQMTPEEQNRSLILAIADRLGIEASPK